MSRRTAPAIGWPALVLLAALTAFHYATLRPGHIWGDDFALYVQHARNLVTGQPYGATGYLHDPLHSGYSPTLYPPGFPVLLAVPVAIAGTDVESLKRIMPLLCAGFLLAYLLWLRILLPPRAALLAVAVVGLAPGLWKLRDNLMSDVPFAGFVFLALWLLRRLDESPPGESPPGRARPGLEALAALAIYAGYATRVVGAALLPALVLRDLLRFRRVRGGTLRIAAVTVALALLQEALLGTVGAYFGGAGDEAFSDLPGSLVAVVGRNVLAMPWRLGFFFHAGLPPALAVVVSGALLLAAAWGFLVRLRRGPDVPELFALVYAGGLTIFAFLSPRYLLPVFPLVVAWLLVAVREPPALLASGRRALRAAAAALVAIAVAGGYATADRGPLPQGIHEPDARALFAFVERELPPETLCVFRKPRALALLGDVRATLYPNARWADRVGPHLRRLGASCFVRWEAGDRPHYLEYLDGETGLEPVFANDTFTLYLRRDAAPQGGLRAPAGVESTEFGRFESAVRSPPAGFAGPGPRFRSPSPPRLRSR